MTTSRDWFMFGSCVMSAYPVWCWHSIHHRVNIHPRLCRPFIGGENPDSLCHSSLFLFLTTSSIDGNQWQGSNGGSWLYMSRGIAGFCVSPPLTNLHHLAIRISLFTVPYYCLSFTIFMCCIVDFYRPIEIKDVKTKANTLAAWALN